MKRCIAQFMQLADESIYSQSIFFLALRHLSVCCPFYLRHKPLQSKEGLFY